MTDPRGRIDRRRLLKATGLATGSLFLPSQLGDRRAYAQQSVRRLVIFCTQLGPCYENWRMRRPGLPEDQDWEFPLDGVPENEWSVMLRPLYAQRNNILPLDGIAMTSIFADPPSTNNDNAGNAHVLTGAHMVRRAGFNNEGTGGAASVDQVVANRIAPPGSLKSLVFSSGYAPTWLPSFVGPNQPSVPDQYPDRAFDRLFGASQPNAVVAAARARARVVDLVKNEFTALSTRLGGEDRKKLERHRSLISDLSVRFQPQALDPCAAPVRPTAKGDPFSGRNVPALTRAYSELTAAALACDMTRVAVIVAGQLAPEDFGAAPGTDVHQDIYDSTGGDYPPTMARYVEAIRLMGEYHRVFAEQFAYLLGLLQEHELLDGTAVLWMAQEGPAHSVHRVMCLLAGRAGGAFNTGRYVRYKETGPNPATLYNAYGGGMQPLGPAHNHVLVSLMQAMGLSDNSIGITEATGGLVRNGERIDLTGPMPRLR